MCLEVVQRCWITAWNTESMTSGDQTPKDTVEGVQTCLSFGLCEQVSVTAFSGIRFLQTSKFIATFAEEPELHVLALGGCQVTAWNNWSVTFP